LLHFQYAQRATDEMHAAVLICIAHFVACAVAPLAALSTRRARCFPHAGKRRPVLAQLVDGSHPLATPRFGSLHNFIPEIFVYT
jgi:hypothetical protein